MYVIYNRMELIYTISISKYAYMCCTWMMMQQTFSSCILLTNNINSAAIDHSSIEDDTFRKKCRSGPPMMTSSSRKKSALLALCARKSPGTGEFPSQRLVTRRFGVLLICAWTNSWANNPYAGDLRRPGAHYDVTLMGCWCRLVIHRHGILCLVR